MDELREDQRRILADQVTALRAELDAARQQVAERDREIERLRKEIAELNTVDTVWGFYDADEIWPSVDEALDALSIEVGVSGVVRLRPVHELPTQYWRLSVDDECNQIWEIITEAEYHRAQIAPKEESNE